jgi:hypothetical protein
VNKNLLLLVFLAGGLLLVYAGALSLWIWVLLTVVTIGARVIAGMDQLQEKLSMDGEGVRREHTSPMRQPMVEQVRWDELSKVEVLSHETGPGRKDLLFLLYGSGTAGVAVPGPLADQHGLVPELQRRLAGFSEDKLAQARAESGRARFLLWQQT